MKSSKISLIISLKQMICPAAEKKKTAAGQTDSSCPNALSGGGFDYSKPLLLYPLAAH